MSPACEAEPVDKLLLLLRLRLLLLLLWLLPEDVEGGRPVTIIVKGGEATGAMTMFTGRLLPL